MKKKKIFILLLLFCSILLGLSYTHKTEAAKKLKLNYTNKIIYLGDSLQLKASGIKGTKKWKSNNPDVAFVDKNGKVITFSTGKAKITCSVGKYKASCNIKVVEKSKKIVLVKDSIKLRVDDKISLEAKVVPKRTSDKFVYVSSNEKIVKVDKKGNAIGVGVGKATITVYLKSNNDVYKKCKVKVFEKGGSLITDNFYNDRVNQQTGLYLYFSDKITEEEIRDIKVFIEGKEVGKTIDFDCEQAEINDKRAKYRIYMTLSEDIFNRDENNHNVETASYDIIVTYKNSDMVSRCSACVVTL